MEIDGSTKRADEDTAASVQLLTVILQRVAYSTRKCVAEEVASS